LKVFYGLKNLEEPTKFKGWLSSIVRTTCVDWLRKEKIKPYSLDKMAENGIEPSGKVLGSTTLSPSKEQEELREKVLTAVNSLPKIYQETVLLRHLRGFTYKEMSDFLGVSIATIESRLYRARLLLKERLQDLYD
jgi:RNA polymerase sigma-70 factor (ECF subfamily)